jgi:hypothetical protein
MSNAGTRGRLAEERQAHAISRVIALAPERKSILEALERVAGSASFQSSRRSQEFLRHIVVHALAAEFDQLKERCIGAALFGRPGDYDTGSDAVVRVTANDVRKRLAAYYEEGRGDDPVTFELPPGSYIPEIHLTSAERRPLVEIEQVIPVELRPAERVSAAKPLNPWPAIAICGWVVALFLGVLLARSLAVRAESPQGKSVKSLPWVSLFESGKTPRLILADASMGSLRELHPFPASVEDYANRRFLTPPDDLDPGFVPLWKSMAAKRHTSMADARIAAEYTPLALAAGRQPLVMGARDISLNDFHRGENFILLGGSSSNPWGELFQEQMDFVFHFNPGKETKVEIRNPRPGDPKELVTYVPTGRTGQAYATISLLHGLDGRGRVLIIQGTNMEGTDLAGVMALNPESMSAQLRSCGLDPANPAGRFEILLRLTATAGSTSSSTVLARRCQTGG